MSSSIIARTQQAVTTYRFALPWLMLKKLLAPMFVTEKILLFRRAVPERSEGPWSPAAPASVAIHRLDSAASPWFDELCRQYPDKQFAARWREFGTLCFVAVVGDSIAGFAWSGRYRLRIAEINYQYPLAGDELFIYDCFVVPAYRGQGVYPAMIAAILADSSEVAPPLKRALIAVSSVNRPSIRGIVKAGFTKSHRIVYLKCSGRERWWGLEGPRDECAAGR